MIDHPHDVDPFSCESRLLRTQALTKVGTWELDLKTGTVWGSPEATHIYGLAPSADHILPFSEIHHMALPEYEHMLSDAMTGLIADDLPYDVEFEIQRKSDGGIRTIHSRAVLMRDDSGEPLAISGSVQDITFEINHYKKMIAAFKDSEERSRMNFEQAADAIILGDHTGHFVDANAKAAELTGYSKDELLSMSMDKLFSSETLGKNPLRYDLLAIGKTLIRERMLIRKDKTEIPIEMHCRKLPDGGHHAIIRDLTERRHLEEQLQLRQRMDSIGGLASGIAHDFNNILAGIMGYASLLSDLSDGFDPIQKEYIDNILNATHRGSDLIQRLKIFSHPREIESHAFDLITVAGEVFQVLLATSDRVIRKEFHITEGECLVRGNSSDIHHVIMNCIVNAVQAIEAKGPSTEDLVSISAESLDITGSEMPGIVPGRYVHISHADTGVGMTDDVRAHAFEPLFSTKDKGERKGQGLGLAIVYNIVVCQHGGTIDIDSAPGQGCRINIYLPAADHLTPAVIFSADVTAKKGHGRILVVEDEPLLLNLNRTILTHHGYDVCVSADGHAAVDLFEREGSTIDLVVLDRSLPGLR